MNRRKKISSLLYYLLHAQTRHGVHSPFVYQLFDEVIRDFSVKNEYKEVEKYRSGFLKSKATLERSDFGAGISDSGKTQKKVAEIARMSTKGRLYGRLLFRLARHFKPETIVELGTCFGIGSLYLSKACPDSRVFTLEGCTETAKIAQSVFDHETVSNISLLQGLFDENLPCLTDKIKQPIFVYVDGNHRKKPTLDYFNFFLPLVNEESVLVFDDIHWSEEMEEAWNVLQSHPAVTISVDLYQFGILFFRKEIIKQHFILRFPV